MLYDVKHPGKGDRNIVELGIVDKVEIDGDKVTLTLAFPKHRDPLTEYIVGSAKAAIYRQAPEVKEVIVNAIVREESAPKKQTGLNLSLDEVNNVRHIIGVASGKGGVGKSTVAVNLAVALARLGYKVGLADADVYGPSVPKMTATEGALPEAVKEDDKEIIMPIEKYGVKWMSIGYFAEPGQALIWRGPMACNALKQMILQVRWGILDFLLIDMPPGTGDIHISLVNDIPMEGALIVTTPQPVPLMTGTEGFVPEAEEIAEGKEVIYPIEKYGVKWMSIGYFAEPGQALIWRGPMACNALKQMILQVRWGILDFLLIDMPPGTGDIHISLVNDIPMEGALIVTTPQPVALSDVEKGVNMFRNKNIDRKIFGLVENMAWFTPEELPENKYYIFGKNGGKEMADKYGIPLLGQIPIVQSIREGGDSGEPAALSTRPDGQAFIDLAGRLAKAVES